MRKRKPHNRVACKDQHVLNLHRRQQNPTSNANKWATRSETGITIQCCRKVHGRSKRTFHHVRVPSCLNSRSLELANWTAKGERYGLPSQLPTIFSEETSRRKNPSTCMFDWHVAKNVGKRLNAYAVKARYKQLRHWVSQVKNCFR